MRVVVPYSIGAAQLTSSSIPEPDSSVGEVEYNAGTTYAVGDRVIRASTHRVYESLVGSNTGNTPETSPDHWLDVGATNRFAALDLMRTIPSTDTGTLTIEITPGQRVDSIALLGLTGGDVSLSVSVPGEGVLLTRTQDLSIRNTTGWYSYFFGAFRQRRNVVFLDLPPISNGVYTITLTDTGTVAITGVIFGMAAFLGCTEYNTVDDALNFSKVERDDNGTATLIRRRIVPTLMPPVKVVKTNLPRVREVRDDTRGIAALWIGIDTVDNAYFDSLLIFGVWKRFAINLANPTYSDLTLEIEAL